MGQAEEYMMEMDDLGITGGEGGNVCGECIGDPVLARFISDNASEKLCSYCGKKESNFHACPLGEVVVFMAHVINEEWTDPANELPYESREGGYQGDILNPWELLEEIEFSPNHPDVFDHVATQLMGHDWCRDDYYAMTPLERASSGWRNFCNEVMHSRRYTFWTSMDDGNPEYHPDYLPPGKMLAEVEEVVKGLSLIEEFPKRTQFWRVQEHDKGEKLKFPERFTSPPVALAKQPNRMSPSGVPMFYGAEDFDTAVLEVSGRVSKTDRDVSGIAFEAFRPLKILDLVTLRNVVSYFSADGRVWQHRAGFLQFFNREVSKPIKPSDQHIEYVPTQVFTEYVRYHMSAPNGHPIDGIRYRSSLNYKSCYVLFLNQDDCLHSHNGKPQSLRAVADSLKTLSLEKSRK